MTKETETKTTLGPDGKVVTTQIVVTEKEDPPPMVITTVVDESGNTVQVRSVGDNEQVFNTPDRKAYNVLQPLHGDFQGRNFKGTPGDVVFLSEAEAQILSAAVKLTEPTK